MFRFPPASVTQVSLYSFCLSNVKQGWQNIWGATGLKSEHTLADE